MPPITPTNAGSQGNGHPTLMSPPVLDGTQGREAAPDGGGSTDSEMPALTDSSTLDGREEDSESDDDFLDEGDEEVTFGDEHAMGLT